MKTVAQTVQCHPKIHHMQPIQLEVGSQKQWHTVDGGYWPLQIQLSVYKVPVAKLLKLGSDIFEIGSSGGALHTNSRFVCPWWQVKSFSKTLPISSHLCQYSIASKTLGAVLGSPLLLGLKQKHRINLTQSWYQNKLYPKQLKTHQLAKTKTKIDALNKKNALDNIFFRAIYFQKHGEFASWKSAPTAPWPSARSWSVLLCAAYKSVSLLLHLSQQQAATLQIYLNRTSQSPNLLWLSGNSVHHHCLWLCKTQWQPPACWASQSKYLG